MVPRASSRHEVKLSPSPSMVAEDTLKHVYTHPATGRTFGSPITEHALNPELDILFLFYII